MTTKKVTTMYITLHAISVQKAPVSILSSRSEMPTGAWTHLHITWNRTLDFHFLVVFVQHLLTQQRSITHVSVSQV